MAETSIEWTHREGTVGRTWNPTTGCDKISPGCGLPRFPGDKSGGCYALAMAKRLKGMGQAKYQNDGDPRTSGPGFGVTIHPDALTDPLRWRKPTTVFVNSMSDLFHARVPRDFISQVFATMLLTPQHTYQILTKRPERMQRILGEYSFWGGVVADAMEMFEKSGGTPSPTQTQPGGQCALLNVWLGSSIESDKYVRRADALRATPAAVRFISAEPLLGPLPSLDLTDIDWLIAGGESGPDSRPMDLGWVRALIAKCRESGAAPFVKQLGALQTTGPKDKKGGDWSNWPADLRVREYPTIAEEATA
jgi:protein gp37